MVTKTNWFENLIEEKKQFSARLTEKMEKVEEWEKGDLLRRQDRVDFIVKRFEALKEAAVYKAPILPQLKRKRMNVERKFILACGTMEMNPEEVTLEDFLAFDPEELMVNTRGFGKITHGDVIWHAESADGSHYMFAGYNGGEFGGQYF